MFKMYAELTEPIAKLYPLYFKPAYVFLKMFFFNVGHNILGFCKCYFQ